MTKVAVVISGCGSLDGAEIFETVFTLLESLLGIFPAACGVIWRNEQIYT